MTKPCTRRDVFEVEFGGESLALRTFACTRRAEQKDVFVAHTSRTTSCRKPTGTY